MAAVDKALAHVAGTTSTPQHTLVRQKNQFAGITVHKKRAAWSIPIQAKMRSCEIFSKTAVISQLTRPLKNQKHAMVKLLATM